MPRGSSQIRVVRTKLGWSQLDLATRADVSVRTVQFAESGTQPVSTNKLQDIAAALGLAYEDVCRHEDEAGMDEDEAMPWSLSRYIQSRMAPPDEAYCENEKELRDAVRQMRSSWKLHLQISVGSESTAVERFNDAVLNRMYQKYEERYVSIWEQNPLCLMFATSNRHRVGACVVLPVTDHAYQSFLDGKLSFMDIGPQHIEDQSQKLILDSAVEFAHVKHREWLNFTRGISYTIFSQIAMQSIDPGREDFCMASFCASPFNAKRLASMGFIENGTEMPEFGYPICEFSVRKQRMRDQQYSEASTTAHFAHLFKGFCESGLSKKKAMTTALRLLKKVNHVEPDQDASSQSGEFAA